MSKFGIALLVILSYSISLSAQNNYVTLHEDCNYSGKQSVLASGNYRTYQMKIGNDKLSSIQIPFMNMINMKANQRLLPATYNVLMQNGMSLLHLL